MNAMNSARVLHRLITGNWRYMAGQAENRIQSPEARQELVEAQNPMAVVITCADSRVSPEILFDQGLGDLFVVRVAGNVADASVVGSVEFAAEYLDVPLVVVLGHANCGAVIATVEGGEVSGGLSTLVETLRPAVERAREKEGDLVENAIRTNVDMVVEQLRTAEPTLSRLVEERKLKIVGAYYHLDSGQVEFVERNAALEAHLAEREKRFDEEEQMIGAQLHSPGYHTTVADGTWTHATRENLEYALALLDAGGEEREQRAATVIGRVLALQETDPTEATYGIWPWLLEEPLARMSPPDWNWADFCGALLAQMIEEHGAQLPDELRQQMRAALGRAGWAIFRRNVGPGYTNIAIMGAGVSLMAGEILGEERLVEYGRRRLQRFMEHSRQNGGFNEYNSPTYTMVALHECERILQLVEDEEARRTARRLCQWIWWGISEQYHPGTRQWAGPHSRAYRDRLDGRTLKELLIGAGVEEDEGQLYSPIFHQPCSAWAARRFEGLRPEEVEYRNCFVKAEAWEESRWGTTWMTQEACLSSINCEDMWTQRRVLIGYWPNECAEPAVLRLRFLHDGRDFSTAGVYQRQRRNRVLSAFGLLTDKGDFHVHLDRPEGGVFRAKDLRVRYQLEGEGTRVEELGEGRFALCAGEYRAVVHTAPGRFGPHDVAWEAGVEDGRAFVEGVCYRGEGMELDPAAWGDVELAAGVEVLGAEQEPTATGVAIGRTEEGLLEVTWEKMSKLKVPSRAQAGR